MSFKVYIINKNNAKQVNSDTTGTYIPDTTAHEHARALLACYLKDAIIWSTFSAGIK